MLVPYNEEGASQNQNGACGHTNFHFRTGTRLLSKELTASIFHLPADI